MGGGRAEEQTAEKEQAQEQEEGENKQSRRVCAPWRECWAAPLSGPRAARARARAFARSQRSEYAAKGIVLTALFVALCMGLGQYWRYLKQAVESGAY